MNKAGSSKSKSKTHQTSRNSPITTEDLAASLAVGHQPSAQLSPQDGALFKAFQSNLLSLISHELRTPLMGVLNSLTLLEDRADDPQFPISELVRMARQNAQKLQSALSSLLDLAALESGVLHARLREADLIKLIQNRIKKSQSLFKDRNLKCSKIRSSTAPRRPVLADPMRLGRAIDLCIQILIPRARSGSEVDILSDGREIKIQFELEEQFESLWDSAWCQSLAGYQSGVTSPFSAFGGVVQSEQAFLTRTEEGLGSEFLLIHEIMRLHRGNFLAKRTARSVEMNLVLPLLSSEDGLRAVLSSRAYEISNDLASVALILIQVPKKIALQTASEKIQESLFRSTDAVYLLEKKNQLAMVLDDCKREIIPKIIKRIYKKFNTHFEFGSAHCPSDGLDPENLIKLAEQNFISSKTII